MRLNLYCIKLNEEKQTILVKEKGFNYKDDDFTQPENFILLLNTLFQLNRQAEEYVYMIALNAKKPIGIFEISHGCLDSSLLNPREVYIKALLCGACRIIICHNHPSGDPSPSSEDIVITNNLKEAGNILGLNLLDHIIIADNNYFSFHRENML